MQGRSRPFTISHGSWEAQGKRPTMEDRQVYFPKLDDDETTTFVAVYDGHGGVKVSDYLRDHLHEHVSFFLKQGKSVPEALQEGFQQADDILVKKANEEGKWTDGSTAAVAIIQGQTLYVANLGDTEACLVSVDSKGKVFEVVKSSQDGHSNGEPVESRPVVSGEEGPQDDKDSPVAKCITTRHLASSTREAKRIRDMGGRVFFGRVDGVLAVSRAFGDAQHKKPQAKEDFVTVNPGEITTIDLEFHDKYLILACDGLWDVCSYVEAAEIANNAFKSGKTPEEVAKDLVIYAERNDTTDNVSVSVLKFDWVKQFSPIAKSAGLMHLQLQRKNSRPKLENPVNAPYPKTIGDTLDRSYFYLDRQLSDACRNRLGLKTSDLPVWVPQELISKAFFGDSGVTALRQVEEKIKQNPFYKSPNGYFLWATEFANVHMTFNYVERFIVVDGVSYPGPEQYFQLMKSFGTPDHEEVKQKMACADPNLAFELGRSHKMRPDWEEKKEGIMEKAVYAKFSQQEPLTRLLLSTGDHPLVQIKPTDGYWGSGRTGEGLNMLGVILMRTRDLLRKEIAEK